MRDELLESFHSVGRGQDLVSVPLKQHFPALENTEAVIRAEDQRLMIHGLLRILLARAREVAIRCAESCWEVAGLSSSFKMLPTRSVNRGKDSYRRKADSSCGWQRLS